VRPVRTEKGLVRRTEILDAAEDLIHGQGFNRTGLEELLQESGVTKGNFYFYFKSKEELGLAVVARATERWVQRTLPEVFSPAKEPLQRVFDFIDAIEKRFHEADCTKGCLFGNIGLELGDLHDGFRQQVETAFRRWGEKIEETLGEIQPKIPAADRRRLASFVVATMEGTILVGKVHKRIEVVRDCFVELKRHLTARCAPSGNASKRKTRGGSSAKT